MTPNDVSSKNNRVIQLGNSLLCDLRFSAYSSGHKHARKALYCAARARRRAWDEVAGEFHHGCSEHTSWIPDMGKNMRSSAVSFTVSRASDFESDARLVLYFAIENGYL